MRFRFFNRLSSPHAQRQVQKVGGGFLAVITYPFRLLVGFGRDTGKLFATWWESRNLRYLLQGLPSLVMAIAIIVVGTLVFFQDPSALGQEYKDLGQRAQMDAIQQYRTGQSTKEAAALAQTCYKYLGIHYPYNTPENSFHMAETYLLQRQYPAANEVFAKLAPLDPKVLGYGPAHLEVARRLLPPYQPGTPLEKQQQMMTEAENHLYRAVQFDKEPYASTARALLFDILRITNRPEKAEQYLREAVRNVGNSQPQYRRVLASWYLQAGKRDLAEREIELAVASYSKKQDEAFSETDTRLAFINTLQLLGRLRCDRGDFKKGKEEFARAKEACYTGRVMASDPENARKFRFAYYAILLSQYDATANEGKNSPDESKLRLERFRLLDEALNLQPNDRQVLERLSIYLRDPKTTPEELNKAKEAIEKNIAAGGQDSAIGHIILGTDAYRQNDTASARYHWEQAVKMNPEAMPHVANNLAWLLAFSKPSDFDQALKLVNQAIQTAPKSEDFQAFRSTRGHILKKMGRARDAYPDLQEGLKAYAKNVDNGPQLYDALIEVANDLGLTSDAERYKKAKEELLKSAPRRPVPPAAPQQPPPEKKDAAPAPAADKKDAPPPPPKP